MKMIRLSRIGRKRVEVSWDTGEDYRYLQSIKLVIDSRNRDKRTIMNLKGAKS